MQFLSSVIRDFAVIIRLVVHQRFPRVPVSVPVDKITFYVKFPSSSCYQVCKNIVVFLNIGPVTVIHIHYWCDRSSCSSCYRNSLPIHSDNSGTFVSTMTVSHKYNNSPSGSVISANEMRRVVDLTKALKCYPLFLSHQLFLFVLTTCFIHPLCWCYYPTTVPYSG